MHVAQKERENAPAWVATQHFPLDLLLIESQGCLWCVCVYVLFVCVSFPSAPPLTLMNGPHLGKAVIRSQSGAAGSQQPG